MLDYKESWAQKNWCFWTVVLESPLDCKEIQPVHPKAIQSWIFIGRTDGEAEIPILQLPDAKSWLVCKDPDAGKDWRHEEDEMVRWHHQLNGHEFEWTPGVGNGQGSLACCSPWGRKELGMAEWLNWTEWRIKLHNIYTYRPQHRAWPRVSCCYYWPATFVLFLLYLCQGFYPCDSSFPVCVLLWGSVLGFLPFSHSDSDSI